MARLVFAEKPKGKQMQSLRVKPQNGWRSVSLLLEPTDKAWWEDPDVLVAFNLPRISASLERLIGTNVVRLTDRKFMKDLRMSLEEDYRQQLNKRIKNRELKEIERERLLIIEGKSEAIPQELADDPIFVVHKIANVEIQKERSKLKTNREKNAERLKVQGIKWERERLKHEAEEKERLEILRERRQAQKELERRYLEEDAERGMDLLRIDNEDWRECEQKLKQFLDEERAKMKERSNRVPIQFTSDPLDIQNVDRAKEKMREEESKLQDELEEQKKKAKAYSVTKDFLMRSAKKKAAQAPKQPQTLQEIIEPPPMEMQLKPLDSTELLKMQAEEEERMRRKYMDDASDEISEPEPNENVSTISESKRRHAALLQAELDYDIERGYVISKEQYDQLRFTEPKIIQLRHARNVRELYQLAEEIIIGERVEEPVEEEGEEEEILPIDDGEHDDVQ